MAQACLSDLRNGTGEIWMHGWRCLLCGEILDATILANRRSRPKPGPIRSRQTARPIPVR